MALLVPLMAVDQHGRMLCFRLHWYATIFAYTK